MLAGRRGPHASQHLDMCGLMLGILMSMTFYFCGGSFCFMSWCLKYFCAVGALCVFSYF